MAYTNLLGQVRVGVRPAVTAEQLQTATYLLSSQSLLTSPLLDNFSEAAAAYSLRKIRSSYTGFAIRVRRSSDNTEQNIGFDGSGNLDTASLLSFVGTGSGFVKTWYDQSGNSKDAQQTTASSQPNIVNNGTLRTQGTKPSFYFDGVDDYLDCGYVNNGVKPGTFSTWISANITDASQTRNILASGNSGGQGITGYNQFGIHQGVGYKMFGVVGDGNWVNNTESGLYRYYSTSIAPTTNQRYLFEQHYVSNSASTSYLGQFWWNDIRQSVSNWLSTGAVKSSGVEYKTSIGRSGEYVGGGYLQGMVQEIVTYFSDKTSVRKEIASNINTYYGVYTQDTNPIVAAAYSLRKLKGDYTGSAIRVRRSGDNVELNIGFDAGGNLDTASLLSFVGVNNQALYSEEFDNNSYWHKNDSSIVANQTTAPDGTMTADLFREGTSQWNHSLGKMGPTTYVSGTSYNASVYLKKGPGTQAPNTIALGFSEVNTSTLPYVIFNISTGVVVTSGNATGDSNFGYSIEDAGDGWWRCSMFGTITGTLSRTQLVYVRFVNNLNTLPSPTAYVGNINRNIYIWGYQYVNSINDTSALTLKQYRKTSASAGGAAYVTTWYDQSGNSRNSVQTTSSSQPMIVSNSVLNTVGGKPSIKFDGIGDNILTSYNQGTSNEMYFVTQTTDTMFLYPSNNTIANYGFVAQSGSTVGISNNYGSPQLYTNGFLKSVSTRDGVYNVLNGYKLVVHKNVNISTWTSLIFGNYTSAAPGGYDYDGNLQEWLIYPTLQGSQSQIESNINSHYSLWDSSIFQSGLVMNLDAGFKSSYLGTGSTWYDISGSGNNNGTLTNGVGYSSVNGGVMTFDGVNDYVDTGLQYSLTSSTNFTIGIWFKGFGRASNNDILVLSYSGTPVGWAIYQSNTGKFMCFSRDNNNIETSYINSTTSTNTNQWFYGVYKKSGNQFSLYINGVLEATINANLGNISISNGMRIGNHTNISQPYLGSIGSVKVYNKSLTDSEILQNFNATKSRFGL